MLRINQTPVVFKYEHFVGNQILNFDLVDKSKTEKLVEFLHRGATYKEVLHDIFDNNFDSLARSASYAFYLEQITSDELGSMLRYRSMHLSFPQDEVELYPFFNKDKTEFTSEVLGYISTILVKKTRMGGFSVKLTEKEDVQAFFRILKEKPCSEHCYFVFKIPSSYLTANDRVAKFLNLLAKENIVGVKTDDKQQMTSVLVFSMGAKSALRKVLFKDNAKLAFPRLSNTININDIDFSTENDTRFVAAFHSDVADQPYFHSIKVKETIFSSLHDDLHVDFNCKLPNQIFKPWRKAIREVRVKTGIQWSKDIWDTVDGAFSPDLIHRNCLSENTPQAITKLFLNTLDAYVFPEYRAMGLFNQTSFFDTTWLLMIDIALSTKDWLELSIDPAYFSFEYAKMYEFILKNIDLIKDEKNPSKQVALIKAKYFNIDLKAQDEYQFVKKGRYTQLVNKLTNEGLVLDKGILLESMQLLEPIKPLGMTFSDLGMLFVNGDLKLEDLSDDQFKQKVSGCHPNDHLSYLTRKAYFSLSQFKKLSSAQIDLINKDITEENVAYLLHTQKILSSEFMALSIERANLINAHPEIFSLIFFKKMETDAFNELSLNAIQLLLKDNSVYQAVFDKELSLDKLEILAVSQQSELKAVGKKEIDKNKDEDTLKTSSQHLKKLSLFPSQNVGNLNLVNNENNNNTNDDLSLSKNIINAFSLANT